MADTNYISLGDITQKQSFDIGGHAEPLRPQKIIGNTKEERKEIALQIRLAARTEKKKIKSDAKKQRKENAILNRRATKNPEKYNKNKERNHVRAIELERNRIRFEAVRQAERLAAKHDPSGKKFNVGEVIVLENGVVKNKELWQKCEEARKAREAGVAPPPNVNPERQAQIQPNGKPKKLSKKQQQRLDALSPKNVPPKPVLPEGITIPAGEENLIELWDVDDQGIQARLTRQKSEKRAFAGALKRRQQEQKEFNRALKVKKKQAANKGILFDPEQAKREILGEMTETEESDSDAKAEAKSDADDGSEGSDSTSDSDDDSDSDSDSEEKQEEAPKPKKHKRSAEEPAEGQPEAKKSKTSSSGEPSEKKKVKKYNPPPDGPRINMNIVTEEDIANRVKKEQHRVKLDLRRQEKLQKRIEEGDVRTLQAVGLLKRNRKRDDETPEEKAERRAKRAAKKAMIEARKADPEEQARRAKLKEGYAAKKEAKKAEKRKARRLEKIAKAEKKRKRSSFTRGDSAKRVKTENGDAQQWNPDALSGDAARKDKFLRLLGAGKSNGNGEGSSGKGGQKKEVDLEKVQNDLERQFEAGVKMKHEGGAKRRGLGA